MLSMVSKTIPSIVGQIVLINHADYMSILEITTFFRWPNKIIIPGTLMSYI